MHGWPGGGAGSEVWNRVYMIWSSETVQIFLQIWKSDEFWSVFGFPASKHQEKVSMTFFNGPFGHQEAWCVNSSKGTSFILIRNSLLTVESLRKRTCCCCSQPVSRMLATVLEWLTDFLTGAIMESRKTARSKAVASLHLLVVDNRYTA